MFQLSKEQVDRYLPKFAKAAPDTSSSGKPIPQYKSILNDSRFCMLVGELNMFGFRRFYDINSQEDIQQLVRFCMNGASMEVKWYTLKHGELDPEDDIKVVPF